MNVTINRLDPNIPDPAKAAAARRDEFG